jgi:hypothetical protein
MNRDTLILCTKTYTLLTHLRDSHITFPLVPSFLISIVKERKWPYGAEHTVCVRAVSSLYTTQGERLCGQRRNHQQKVLLCDISIY